MPAPTSVPFALVPHPETPCPALRSLAARVAWTPDGGLRLTYVLDGDLAALAIAPPGPGGPGERLYEHTCLEAFLGVEGSEAYLEFNASPSNAWAFLGFRAYREPSPQAMAGRAPAGRAFAGRAMVRTSRREDRLELEAVLSPEAMGFLPPGSLRLGLTAVVEDRSGAHAYWSLRHPPGPPDFHPAFVRVLEAPGVGSPFRVGP